MQIRKPQSLSGLYKMTQMLRSKHRSLIQLQLLYSLERYITNFLVQMCNDLNQSIVKYIHRVKAFLLDSREDTEEIEF